MVSVYCLSHAPALLSLNIPGPDSHGQNARLLFFFVLVVQLNDVFQYAWGKLLGRRVIAPPISPNKTWEGFVGGSGQRHLGRHGAVVGHAFQAAGTPPACRWSSR